jgi:hypothetical protein
VLLLLITDWQYELNPTSVMKRSLKMLRSFSLSVMVILLLSSGVFANIGQTVGQAEGFSISALNKVQRVGGAGWAESGNMVMVDHGQRAYTKGTVAVQREGGILLQGAKVAGLGGATKILQNASVDAGQQQSIAAGRKYDLLQQGQSLTVNLDNVIRNTGGIGTAAGAQGFFGGQSQVINTPNGRAENYQVVGTAQFASVSGSPCSNVVIVNTIDVDMGQGQAVTGRFAPPKP